MESFRDFKDLIIIVIVIDRLAVSKKRKGRALITLPWMLDDFDQWPISLDYPR